MTAAGLDFDFSMAFQPIMDMETGQPFAYEALLARPAFESLPVVHLSAPRLAAVG